MKPHPPVTRNRIAARTSSAEAAAPADFLSLRDQLAAWKAGLAETDWLQWLVCRSNDEERVLSIRSDQLSWAAPLLRSITLAKFVWTERLGFAAAGGAGERQLRVAYIEI